MTRRVIIRPAAESDIAEAHEWYAGRETGLGARFLDAVAGVIDRIVERPAQFPVVHSGVRRALIKGFPYSVYFRVSDEEARIIAVVHLSRDLRFVHRRLRQVQ